MEIINTSGLRAGRSAQRAWEKMAMEAYGAKGFSGGNLTAEKMASIREEFVKESRQIREEATAILMGVFKQFGIIKMHRRPQSFRNRLAGSTALTAVAMV